MTHRLLTITLSLLLCPTLFAADANKPVTLAIGSAAPDFDLPGVDGKNHSLKDFAASPVLVVLFTCNHCPTAQLYEARVKKYVDDYKAKGVALVAISPNDPKSIRLNELGYTDVNDTLEEMKIRAKDQAFNFAYLYDGDKQDASKAYGPVATPHVFVFDKDRKLRYAGRIDDSERPEHVSTNELRDATEALLAGQEPKVTQTRVFGCSIKWAGKEDEVKKYMEKVAAEPVAVEMIDVDGMKALRKNDSGKLRLINVWATWCGPCVAEFPDLIEINRSFRHRDFEMVTVSANVPAEKEKVLAFLTKQQSSGRNVLLDSAKRDPFFDALDKDWSGAIPFTLLLSPTGEVLYRKEGKIDPLELKRVIVKNMRDKRFDNKDK